MIETHLLASRALMRLEQEGECWVWRGANDGRGYGAMMRRGRKHPVHRVIYEGLVGPIPDGYDIDHLCRNRACANPAHLEPVTRRENLLRGDTIPARNARKTHCPAGHSYDAANTRLEDGSRKCRTCCRERESARRERIRAAA